MSFSRRPGVRFNRGRIPTGNNRVLAPPGTALVIQPSNGTTVPEGQPFTILVRVAADQAPNVTSADFFFDYPATPLGAGTQIDALTWSFTYTPDVLQHGAHSISVLLGRTVGGAFLSNSVTVSVSSVPFPGIWAANNGFWIDARLISGAPGVQVSTAGPITEILLEAAPGVTAPTFQGTAGTAPTIRVGAGFTKCLEFVAANTQTGIGNAALEHGSGKPITVVCRILESLGSRVSTSLGNSGNTNKFFDCAWSSGGITRANRRDGILGLQTALFSQTLGLTTKIWIVTSSDGINFYSYLDNVADTSNPQPLNTGLFSTDRYAMGAAFHAASVTSPIDGQIQVMGVMNRAVTPSEASAIYNHIIANDQPTPTGTPITFIGDSTTASGGNGKWRKELYNWYSANNVHVDAVGPQAGGSFFDNQHCGFGGNDMAAVVSQQINIYYGTGKAYSTVQFATLLVGTNDVDVPGKTLAQLQTSYDAAVTALHTRLTSSVATARMCLAEFLPYATSAQATGGVDAAATLVADFNAWVPSYWDAWDAAHPSHKIFRWRPYQALGSGWSTTYFGSDSRHPNDTGYALMTNDTTYGLRKASDGTQTVEQYLTAIGP